jgi:hypothetical protein
MPGDRSSCPLGASGLAPGSAWLPRSPRWRCSAMARRPRGGRAWGPAAVRLWALAPTPVLTKQAGGGGPLLLNPVCQGAPKISAKNLRNIFWRRCLTCSAAVMSCTLPMASIIWTASRRALRRIKQNWRLAPVLWRLSQLGGGEMPIRPFVQRGAFEPEVLAVMGEVFEAACKERPNVAPGAIAQRIVTAAQLGERDPARLRKAALEETS